MEQQNISIYKDNNDLYIRIKNCPDNLETLLSKMMSAIIGETKNIKPVADVKDTPVTQENAKENTDEIVFTWGRYKGLKPSEILNKLGKEKAFVFFKQQTVFDKKLKKNVDDILSMLKNDLAKNLSLDEEPSYDDMNVFFNEYKTLFEDELSSFLNSHNFSNIEEMLNSDNEDKYSLYSDLIKKLIS